MSREEAVKVIKTEMKCVKAANICGRECGECKLVLPDIDILTAYDMAIQALQYLIYVEDDRK